MSKASATNRTLDDGLEVLSLIVGRGLRGIATEQIADLTRYSRQKIRRILRSLDLKNLIEPCDGGWRMSVNLISQVAAFSGEIRARIAELSDRRDLVDSAKRLISTRDTLVGAAAEVAAKCPTMGQNPGCPAQN